MLMMQDFKAKELVDDKLTNTSNVIKWVSLQQITDDWHRGTAATWDSTGAA